MKSLYTYLACFIHLGVRISDIFFTFILLSTGFFYETNPLGFNLFSILLFSFLILLFFGLAYGTRKDKFMNLLVFVMVACFCIFGFVVMGYEIYLLVMVWQL